MEPLHQFQWEQRPLGKLLPWATLVSRKLMWWLHTESGTSHSGGPHQWCGSAIPESPREGANKAVSPGLYGLTETDLVASCWELLDPRDQKPGDQIASLGLSDLSKLHPLCPESGPAEIRFPGLISVSARPQRPRKVSSELQAFRLSSHLATLSMPLLTRPFSGKSVMQVWNDLKPSPVTALKPSSLYDTTTHHRFLALWR